jgi:hypothetical protein
MRIRRRRGKDGRLPPRGQAPNFGGVAKRISSAHSRSLVLDRAVEVSAARIALPHIKLLKGELTVSRARIEAPSRRICQNAATRVLPRATLSLWDTPNTAAAGEACRSRHLLTRGFSLLRVFRLRTAVNHFKFQLSRSEIICFQVSIHGFQLAPPIMLPDRINVDYIIFVWRKVINP